MVYLVYVIDRDYRHLHDLPKLVAVFPDEAQAKSFAHTRALKIANGSGLVTESMYGEHFEAKEKPVNGYARPWAVVWSCVPFGELDEVLNMEEPFEAEPAEKHEAEADADTLF